METNSKEVERVRGGMVFSGEDGAWGEWKGKEEGNKWEINGGEKGNELKFKGGHRSQDAFP